MFAAFHAIAVLVSDETAVLIADVVLKATVLLALASVVDALLRRRSAAVRHRVWCLAFCGLLGLPVLTTLLPSWRLPILPAAAPGSAANLALAEPDPAGRQLDIASTSETGRLAEPTVLNAADRMGIEQAHFHWERLHQPLAFGDPNPVLPALDQSPSQRIQDPSPNSEDAPQAASAISWGIILGALWLIGAAVTAVPLVMGFVRNGTLRRAARPVNDAARTDLVANLSTSLGLRRRVRLLETGRSIVPMTWGVLWPIVLFPAAWRDWTSQRRRLVLLHELAHVKRCDVAFQLIARLSCALYWFHPLAWYALRRLRTERELACDDCVLMTGARPSEYAQELLEIARTYQFLALPTTVAMARSTNLEQRIRALLDRARSRLPLSRTAGVLLLLGAAVLVTGVAAVRPSPRVESAQPTSLTESSAETPASVTNDSPPTSVLLAETKSVNRDASPSAAGGAAKPQAVAESSAHEPTFHYRGRVLNPDGQPVAGARLYFVYWVQGTEPNQDVKPLGVTGADGWFDFTATRADISAGADSYYAGSFSFPLVAIADGFGFAEQSSLVFETTGQAVKRLSDQARQWYDQRLKDAEPVLRLVKDDVPIRGRVVNTEGQPVKGARIAVDSFWYNDEGNLDAWEAAAKEDKADFYSLRQHTQRSANGPQMRSVIPAVTTDADGRFTLRGIGRERVVQLLITGPGIETSQVKTRTRDGETITVPEDWNFRDAGTETYFGAEFTHVAAPSIPIIGRITNADGGEPIAGVVISAGQQQTFLRGGKPWLRASTDENGHYSLEGLPLENEEYLYVTPPTDTAYLPAGRGVTLDLGVKEIEYDFQLKPGIIVRGRVVDDRTGQPLAGPVNYFVDAGNPSLEGSPRETLRRVAHERRSDAEGNFTIAVLPGRGVLTFTPDDHGSYRRGLGASTITMKAENAGSDFYRTQPSLLMPTNYSVVQEINPSADSEPLPITLAPTSGESITGKVLGPDGMVIPDGRVIVDDDAYQPAYYDERRREFRIEGYYPDQPREVYGFHIEQNLAGHLRVEGELPRNLALTLHPAASIRGRLVDDAGAPLSGVQLSGDGIPQDRYGYTDLRFVTDDDGRFHIRGLIPGRKYTVEARGEQLFRPILIDEAIDTPETKDVGNVTVKPPIRNQVFSSPSADNAAAKPPAESVDVTGTVLLPDGSPAAGARVRAGVSMSVMLGALVGADYELPVNETVTDERGNFSISFSRHPCGDLSRLDQDWQDLWKQTKIAASLPGYGGQLVEYKDIEGEGDLTLQLVEDVPVSGRVIDLEGRPVVGLKVEMEDLRGGKDDDLTAWIDAARAGELPWTLPKQAPLEVPMRLIGVPDTVTTDAEGRFTVKGLGRDRLLTIELNHDTVAYQAANIVTREIEPFERRMMTPPYKHPQSVYGPAPTLAVAPSRPIVGVVKDAATGEPLPGVEVAGYKLPGERSAKHRALKTMTDAKGRYRLTGMPKGDGCQIVARPNDDQLYFIRQMDVPNPAGIDPVTVDIDLHRGLWITGRVTDKVTGEPVHARIYYLPYRSNKHTIPLPEFTDDGETHAEQWQFTTDDDGTYRLVGLPGPAVIGADSNHKTYRHGAGYDKLTGPKYSDTDWFDTYSSPMRPNPNWPNAMHEVDIADNAESFVVDLQMDPGASITITTLDADGQPLTGVTVTGIGASSYSPPCTFDTDRFEATGFGSDETRTVRFEKDNLGWIERISPQSASAEGVIVRLRPVATITARLLHQDGSPLTGVNIKPDPHPQSGISYALRQHGVTTDQVGRFRQTLPAGEDYSLSAEGSGIDSGATITRKLTIEPGETRDLGDLKLIGRKFESVEAQQEDGK